MKIRANLGIMFSIMLLLSLITAPGVFAWTITADFEQGVAGAVAQGTSGFTHDAGTATLFSNENAQSGKQSAKLSWIQGTDGFSETNGFFNYPARVGKGGELWVRGYYYFKSPWSFHASPVIKILRGAKIETSGGSHEGWLSVFSGSTGSGKEGEIQLSNELLYSSPDTEFSTGSFFDVDRWQCIEMYVYLSDTNPIFRIWKDGALIMEDRTHPTLINPTDVAAAIDSATLHYWNGGVPQNQTEYVDSFVITTDRPSQRDAKGNYMIGPKSGGPTPSSPVSLSVK